SQSVGHRSNATDGEAATHKLLNGPKPNTKKVASQYWRTACFPFFLYAAEVAFRLTFINSTT
ncbi:MAG TPA: hypothetical protein VGI82_08140, partial [Chitinophagaceae bacterium]